MTVWDFLLLCTDCGLLQIEVRSIRVDGVLYFGWANDAPDEILDAEFKEYDIPDTAGVMSIFI